MKTIKNILSILVLLTSVQGFAASEFSMQIQHAINEAIFADGPQANWVVGDTANYKMKLGFLSGTMKMTVKVAQPTELVIGQEINLAGMGNQSCDMTIDPSTGETKRIVCNGQDQQVQQPNIEVIEMKEVEITVPAGKFPCLYVKAKNKSDNSEIEQWVNQNIPVSGMVKTIAPSPLGKMTVELTSFKKN